MSKARPGFKDQAEAAVDSMQQVVWCNILIVDTMNIPNDDVRTDVSSLTEYQNDKKFKQNLLLQEPILKGLRGRL